MILLFLSFNNDIIQHINNFNSRCKKKLQFTNTNVKMHELKMNWLRKLVREHIILYD